MSKISRREFAGRLAKGLGGGVLLSSASTTTTTTTTAGNRASSPPERPNIVFICSDQHSYKYTGYAGHDYVQTPNLDRIARQGTVFNSAYCGSPVCVPGRASMMTGMYASDSNSFGNSTVWDSSHPTWGKRLKEAGYHCWATGKMDLNPGFDMGFEEIDTGHGHSRNPDITELFRRPVGYRVGERPNVEGRARGERHNDERLTENAEQFIRNEARPPGKPWAAYVGFSQPHPSFVALQKYYDRYHPGRVDMPNIPPGHLEDQHLMFQELRRFKRVATPIPDERVRRARAGYYGMITELDEYIGRLWNLLEETGQLEHTVFVYTSDHGEMLGEHGLWYKNNLYEEAAHIPLVVAGAGLPQGQTVDQPVAHVDLVRTLLEWAGAETPPALRGHSLDVLLQNGEAGDHPGYAYTESHSEGNCTGSFMVRKGDWKYIHFTWHEDRLFNLSEDPMEFTNRIDDPSTKGVREELEEILHSEVDPEEVTLRAFRVQEEMLREIARQRGEEGLFNTLKGRLGTGQARMLANKHSRDGRSYNTD